MKEYIFKKGELNSLNNLNQDLKTVFKTYSLIGNMISGVPLLGKGTHHALTQYIFPDLCSETHILVIESDPLFKCIKTDKKNIGGYRVGDNDDLYLFTDTETYHIGYVIKRDSIAAEPYMKSLKLYCHNNTVTTIKLSSEDVEDLVKNSLKHIQSDKYRTRITREVIPGLKKTHDVYLGFSNIDEKTFGFHITTNRATCITYHSYKCLYV